MEPIDDLAAEQADWLRRASGPQEVAASEDPMGRTSGATRVLRPSPADEAIAKAVQLARENSVKQFGVDLITPSQVTYVESHVAAEWDRDLATSADALAKKITATQAEVQGAIDAAGVLRSPAQEWGGGSDKFLSASILDELQVMRVRQEIAASGASVPTLAKAYEKSHDEHDSVFVRIIEKAHQAGMLESLGIRFDGTDEGTVAALQLSELIAARRAKRVPPSLTEAQQRLERMEKSLPWTELRRHLASGRGIAARPKVA